MRMWVSCWAGRELGLEEKVTVQLARSVYA